MTQPLEVSFTRDQHRSNAARCRAEERRLRSAHGRLDHPTAMVAACWRESACAYDEMADFLDAVIAAGARNSQAKAATA